MIAISTSAASAAQAPACRARSGEQVMPLVELYTSEGCSSCPPADRWLRREAPNVRANFVAFHVDYWDRLGWPDRFASPANSQRQRRRVAAAGERTVYTPQVMVGTTVQAPWRDPVRFDALLAAQRQPTAVDLQLAIEPGASAIMVTLQVSPRSTPIGDASIWLLRYHDGQRTAVTAGENRGVELRHDRVVHRVWGPWRLRATPLNRSIDWSRGAERGGLVAFVQDADGRVLQSLGIADLGCL